MSYTPNVWANGDVVTSAKLNAMEQGIAAASGGGGGGTDWLVVHATQTSIDDPFVLDKTASELMDAAPLVICVKPSTFTPGAYQAGCLGVWGLVGGEYGFDFGGDFYSTESLDGYPVGAGEQ